MSIAARTTHRTTQANIDAAPAPAPVAHAPVGAGTPAWVERREAHRVDPCGEGVSFTLAGVRYLISARGAVVIRGDVARPLPASAFEGVAARAMETEDGSVTVTLELLHADEALSVPVLVADDLHDVAADWRAWARRTGLPMLMIEGDGTIEVLDAAPRPLADAPHERRRPSRRPRFLVRRQTGSMGVSMRIEGREMFAGV